MNEKIIKANLDNIINLRTTYYSMMFVLTGSLVNLCYDLTAFNICLLVIGVFIDCYFLLKLNNLSMRIKKLLKLMRGV